MHSSIMHQFSMFYLILAGIVYHGCTASVEETQQEIQLNPKKDKFVVLVEEYGYGVESHEVITEDGYILTTHRIQGRLGTVPVSGKPVVILLHGQFASGISWVMRGPGKSLSYSLVDAGYDVWHLNARGSTYCRRHIKLLPNEDEFWKFSWHEVGFYDLAANIDYILPLTGMKQISMVGHSMGVLVSHVLLSSRPEYNEKVNVVVSLAASVIYTHVPFGSTYSFMYAFGDMYMRLGKFLMRAFRMHGLLENGMPPLVKRLMNFICGLEDIGELCVDMMFIVLPFPDHDQVDKNIQVEVMEHYPDSTSLQTLAHSRQIILTRKFAEYDFGTKENMALYGRRIPPEYALANMTALSVMYYGLNDGVATRSDAEALAKVVPNTIIKAVPHPFFNHMDFMIAKDVKVLLYDDVIETINNATQGTLQPSTGSNTTLE